MENVCTELERISLVVLNKEINENKKAIKNCEKGIKELEKKPKIKKKFEKLCQELTTKYNCLMAEWQRRQIDSMDLGVEVISE